MSREPMVKPSKRVLSWRFLFEDYGNVNANGELALIIRNVSYTEMGNLGRSLLSSEMIGFGFTGETQFRLDIPRARGGRTMSLSSFFLSLVLFTSMLFLSDAGETVRRYFNPVDRGEGDRTRGIWSFKGGALW